MIAVLYGPPGSGKGTQADRLAARIGGVHVGTGDMLRAEARRRTPLGEEVAPLMAAGVLVPDELIVRVIERRLTEPDAAGGVIFDGFPRTVPQARALDAMLARGGGRVDVVLVLDVPEEDRLARILRRGELDDRLDDTAEAFARRMEEFRLETEPVLDHYLATGTSVETIDGVGSVDEVTERAVAACARVRAGATR